MEDMPDDKQAGSVDEFMFKEGVNDQLTKVRKSKYNPTDTHKS